MKKKIRSGQFNFRATPDFLDSLSAASVGLGVERTKLIERALAAFAPEYFAAEARDDSSSGHCAKYAPQLFEERRDEKSSDRSGGPAVPEAKRKGCDSKGSREKFSEQ
jgi:hypothetical protein